MVIETKPSRSVSSAMKLYGVLQELLLVPRGEKSTKRTDAILTETIQLLKQDANPNAILPNGITVMHLAADLGRTDVMTILLQNFSPNKDYQGNPLVIDINGQTALSVILSKKADTPIQKNMQIEMVRCLLNAVEKPNELLNDENDTFMHLCATHGTASHLTRFLNRGGDPNSENEYGHTLLFNVVMQNAKTIEDKQRRYEMADLLLQREADPNAKILNSYINKQGELFIYDYQNTLMHVVASKNDANLMELFLNHGGNRNAKNIFGHVPARNAINNSADLREKTVYAEKLDLLSLLIKSKEELLQKDHLKNSLLSYLPGEFYQDIFKRFVKDWNNYTPEEQSTLIGQTLLSDHGDFSPLTFLSGQKPSPENIERFKKAKTVTDADGNQLDDLSEEDLLYYQNDFCRRVVNMDLMPVLLALYGSYEVAEQTLQDRIVTRIARINGEDLPFGEMLVDFLAKAVNHELFKYGPGNRLNPEGNTGKMASDIPIMLRNGNALDAVIDRRAKEGLRDVELYKKLGKRTDVIELNPLIEKPTLVNGLWVFSVPDSEVQRNLGIAHNNCWNHLLPDLMYKSDEDEIKDIVIVAEDINNLETAYAFGIELRKVTKEEKLNGRNKNKKEETPAEEIEVIQFYSPYGFANKHGDKIPENVREAIKRIPIMLKADLFGDLKEKYHTGIKGAEERNTSYDRRTTRFGFDPIGPNAMANRERALDEFDKVYDKKVRSPRHVDFIKYMTEIVGIVGARPPEKIKPSEAYYVPPPPVNLSV